MFSRLVRYSSRRSWSDYILAKRVDGKLVEAEITTDDSRMSMSTKMTASSKSKLCSICEYERSNTDEYTDVIN